MLQVLDVLEHRMVSEVIDLELAEGEKEAVPLVTHFSPITVFPQSAEGID